MSNKFVLPNRSIIAAVSCIVLPSMASAQSTSPFKLVDSSATANVNQEMDPNSGLFYVSPQAQFTFVSAGVSAADYDNDGDIDFFVPNGPEDPTGDGLEDRRPNLLYINNLIDASGNVGTATYTPVEFSSLVTNWDSTYGNLKSVAAVWTDYDGDRLLDLVVFGDFFATGIATLDLGTPPSVTAFEEFQSSYPEFAKWAAPRVYRQRHDGSFEDKTSDAGMLDVDLVTDMYHASQAPNSVFEMDDRQVGGICSGDITGDGYPEIFLSFWRADSVSSQLVRNAKLLINEAGPNGRRFVEAPGGTLTVPTTDPDGLIQDNGDDIGNLWQPVMVDLDGDGDLDIFAACDGLPNRLWINESQAGSSISLAYIDTYTSIDMEAMGTDMGVAVGDYDNDNDFDLFTTNIASGLVDNGLYRNSLELTPSPLGGVMKQVADLAGVTTSAPTWNWGASFADLDSDGWLDLIYTNQSIGVFFSEISKVFMNVEPSDNPSQPDDPGREFHNELFDSLSNVGFPSAHHSSTVIVLDYDRDGDLDVIETVANFSSGALPSDLLLYENVPTGIGQTGYNMTVKPRGDGSNGFAVGAKISVFVDKVIGEDLSMHRAITAGISFVGQEPAEAHFGLGDLDPADSIAITVDWLDPNQSPTILTKTGADIIAGSSTVGGNVFRIGWCSYADLSVPFGQFNHFDVSKFIGHYNAGELEADFAFPFGVINFFDVSRFLTLYGEGCNLD